VLVFDRDREWSARRHKIHDLSVRSVVACPGTHGALTSSSDGTARLWDIETGEVRRTVRICPSGKQVYLDCSADGRTAVAGDARGTIHVWSPASDHPPRTFKGPVGNIQALALNPPGTVLAASDRTVRGVSLWNVESGAKLADLPRSGKIAFALAFDPSGTRLAVGDHNGRIDIYDAVRAVHVFRFEAHSEQLRGICYNPGGTRLATASMDQLIKVWDPVTGRELLSLKGHTRKIYCVAFSPDGTLLASGGRNGQLRLWLGECLPPRTE
jgi:WD40 repeat protein